MIIPALKKTYKGNQVLDFPETEIPNGSITAICGHNGSGKSTLAKILAGIISSDNKKEVLTDKKIGYMNQIPLAFRLSVKNNLLQNADRSQSKKEASLRADGLLKNLELENVSKKLASRLSGGQIQKMSLARILMKDYDILILDEPTASLDAQIIPAAEKLICDYHKRTGCTLLLITHSIPQAQRLSDSIIILEDGKIRKTATPDLLY